MPIVFALYRVGAIVVLIDPGMGRMDCSLALSVLLLL